MKKLISIGELNDTCNTLNVIASSILNDINTYLNENSLFNREYDYSCIILGKHSLKISTHHHIFYDFDGNEIDNTLEKIKEEDKYLRNIIKKNDYMYKQLSLLDDIIKIIDSLRIHTMLKKQIFCLYRYKGKNNCYVEGFYLDRNVRLFDDFKYLNSSITSVYVNDFKKYDSLLEMIDYYKKLNKIIDKSSFTTSDLFSKDGKVIDKYQNRTLEGYDLSNIIFDNKNISGLDISCNPEVNINMDKIVKDLTNSNLKGYDLNKYKFIGFDLTNTNLSDTGCSVDLSNCVVSFEGKLGKGTIFDEDNKLMYGKKKLSHDEARKLGIKVLRKENSNR